MIPTNARALPEYATLAPVFHAMHVLFTTLPLLWYNFDPILPLLWGYLFRTGNKKPRPTGRGNFKVPKTFTVFPKEGLLRHALRSSVPLCSQLSFWLLQA